MTPVSAGEVVAALLVAAAHPEMYLHQSLLGQEIHERRFWQHWYIYSQIARPTRRRLSELGLWSDWHIDGWHLLDLDALRAAPPAVPRQRAPIRPSPEQIHAAIQIALEHPEHYSATAFPTPSHVYVHPVRFRRHWTEYSEATRPSLPEIGRLLEPHRSLLHWITPRHNSGWRRLWHAA